MTILQLLASVAVAPTIAACTYLRGRDKGWKWLPIGAVLLAAEGTLAGVSAAALTLHHQGPIVGVSGALGVTTGSAWLGLQLAACWLAWRGWGWDDAGGEVMTPRTTGDYLHTLFRHAFALAFLWPFWSIRAYAAPLLAVWVLGAVAAAAWRTARRNAGHDDGKTVEAAQGLSLGIYVAALLLIRHVVA